MASLMETLIDTLNKEVELFDQLLALSMRKTPAIVASNLETLQEITDEEQNVVSKIAKLEKSRDENMSDIASVLNKDVKTMNLKSLIEMMGNRPKEQRQLAEVHDKLKDLTVQLQRANQQNEDLINNALEMVRFDLNLLQTYNSAPETANYNKGAYNVGNNIYSGYGSSGGFDAKQ